MWQIIGNTKAVTTLENSITSGQLSHAYLLVGPPHTGKFTLALNLAQAVNCKSDTPPCQECTPCHRIAASKFADLHIIDLIPSEKKKGIGIDQIRDMQTTAHLPPYEGRYKVFIIDHADLFSHEAANSLLKILEEPPPNTLIILLTARENALLPTVVSRCQRLELKPLPLSMVKDILINDYQVMPDKADLLARISRGCFGWALLALRDQTLLAEREQRLADFNHLCAASTYERLTYAAELASMFGKGRDKVADILSSWLQWWHDLLLIKCGNKRWITNIDQEAVLSKQAERVAAISIARFMRHIQETGRQLEQNANPRLALEVLLLRMP